jgi:hypothetical protein
MVLLPHSECPFQGDYALHTTKEVREESVGNDNLADGVYDFGKNV